MPFGTSISGSRGTFIPPAAAASVAAASSPPPAAARRQGSPGPSISDEYPQVVQELVMNGFELSKVVRAYELIGDRFDDISSGGVLDIPGASRISKCIDSFIDIEISWTDTRHHDCSRISTQRIL